MGLDGFRVVTRSTAFRRRAFLLIATVASTVAATVELANLLSVKGLTGLEISLLCLFAVNFSWIAVAFWSAMAGFFALVTRQTSTGLQWPAPVMRLDSKTRVAVVMPVFNEEPGPLFVRLQAMYESLSRLDDGQAFDFFILSDTNHPDIWVEEEVQWSKLCQRVGGRGRIFYRRRPHNLHKKSGNVADFVQRWGARYELFAVLDADSLMAGETLVTMARLMATNPNAGIIQAPPVLIGAESLFARFQQFAASVFGPINSAGLSYWQLGDSNYWGHNAIIRTQAFAKHCGLPMLPGRAPFGGEIFSHDFVEAALMRRGGYSVWLVPELGGSFESPPPTLLAHAKRDRRWCQGNLQHLPLIFSERLHPMSRLHFAFGVMSYVAAPLWLVFLCLGLLAAWQDRFINPVYFGSSRTLFPHWPTFEVSTAIRLAVITLNMLFIPKLLGLGWMLWKTWGVSTFTRRLQMTVSMVIEMLWSMLIAPIFMALQTLFVVTTLTGHTVSWNAQQREGGGTSWREAATVHAVHTLLGLAFLSLGIGELSALRPWLVPLVTGLLLAIPISVFSSRVSWGQRLKASGLAVSEEEAHPDDICLQVQRLQHVTDRVSTLANGLTRVLNEPSTQALHLALLTCDPPAAPPAAMLTEARRKWKQGAAEVLSQKEKLALLCDPRALLELEVDPDVSNRNARAENERDSARGNAIVGGRRVFSGQ